MPATTVKKKSKKDKQKIAVYFNTKEYEYVKFVAEKLLGVGVRAFAKGAAIEMARASIDLAKQRDEANQQGEAANDSNEARPEEVTTTVDTSASDERTSSST